MKKNISIFNNEKIYENRIKDNFFFLIAIIITVYFVGANLEGYFSVFENIHYPLTIFINFYFLIIVFFYPILFILRHINKIFYFLSIFIFSSLIFTYLFVDYYFYKSFKYHINSFVFEVLASDYAFKTLGLDFNIVYYIIIIFLVFFLASVGIFLICFNIAYNKFWFVFKIKSNFLIIFFLITLTFVDKGIFSWLSFINSGYEVSLRKNIPLYIPLDIKGYFKIIGLSNYENKNYDLKFTKNNIINYPLNDYSPKIINNEEKLNVIYIIVDALRYDMVVNSIMPNVRNTFNLIGTEFNNHYSGSNGTGNALFSLFYGLPSSYLENFSLSKVEPIFFRFFKKNNYQIKIFSSQPLDYWNIKESIFREIKMDIEDNFKGGSIENDLAIKNLAKRYISTNNKKNFFLMVFFDSPHLPHFEHPNYKKFQPFGRDINFNPDNYHERVNGFNAYKNSANYIDDLVGELFETIKQNDLLKKSIIIFTSDHGSEKYEHGHWGHASAFTKEQLKVPFWIYHPNIKNNVISKMTDHHDIVPTVFSLIGEDYPSYNHTIGEDIFTKKEKKYHIASGHANWVVYNNKYKINSTIFEGYSYYDVTDIDDNKIDEKKKIIKVMNSSILNSLKDRSKFLK